jgi:ABC-type Mn2+/Zn2+ transport system ATPase subunit
MRVPGFIGALGAGTPVRSTTPAVTLARKHAHTALPARPRPTPLMGLNAKSMSKGKGKGGKQTKKSSSGARGGTATGTPARAGASKIDTHRKEFVFQMQGVSKTLNNGKKILSNINLSFFPGAKIGVLGSNGSGKSTLLKIMAGVDSEYDGVALPQAGAKIGYLPQEPVLVGETVSDAINDAVSETRQLLDKYAELSAKVADESLSDGDQQKLSNEWARLQDAIDAKDGWELERNIERALDALRCPPGDAKNNVLSGGERRRVALCGLLLGRPDLLILDEPTNALDAESVLWLERFLETFSGTVRGAAATQLSKG